MPQYSTLLLIVAMIALFYFLILRPQKKKQQALANTIKELTTGTRILLASGVFGTIVQMGERQAVLEIAPGVQMTVLKQAIIRVAGPGDEEPDAQPDDSADDSDAATLAGIADATDNDPDSSEPVNYTITDNVRNDTPEHSGPAGAPSFERPEFDSSALDEPSNIDNSQNDDSQTQDAQNEDPTSENPSPSPKE